MEFAHINAILRSAHFPPYDPWFADGYINYYYYGLYLVAFCFKLTGIPSEIAFNLAQPTVMALLAGVGYGVAATMSRGVVRLRSVSAIGGVTGALLLVGIGNLEAITQVARALPDRYTPSFGLTWQASRVIPFTINEFPYFTGLYADLHAHVVALPMTVLVVGLCLAIARESRSVAVALSESTSRSTVRARLGVRLALLTLALGALFPTNAWDVPVYGALAVVSIFMATSALRGLLFRLSLTTLVAAVCGALAYLLYLPFHSHYVALFGSVERVRSTTGLWVFLDHLGGLLAICGFGLIVALAGVTRGGRYFKELPLAPLVILASLLLAASFDPHGTTTVAAGIRVAIVLATAALFTAAALPGAPRGNRASHLVVALLAVGLSGTLLAAATDRLALALALGFATGGAGLWLRGEGTEQRFLGMLVAAGALVAAGVEVVFLADDLVTIEWYRMNTVFKFYNQTWVLLALAGAASMALMVDRVAGLAPTRDRADRLGIVSAPSMPFDDGEQAAVVSPAPPASAPRWALFGVGASALVILASLAYPLLATKPRLELRFEGHPSAGHPQRVGLDELWDIVDLGWRNDLVRGGSSRHRLVQ